MTPNDESAVNYETPDNLSQNLHARHMQAVNYENTDLSFCSSLRNCWEASDREEVKKSPIIAKKSFNA